MDTTSCPSSNSHCRWMTLSGNGTPTWQVIGLAANLLIFLIPLEEVGGKRYLVCRQKTEVQRA